MVSRPDDVDMWSLDRPSALFFPHPGVDPLLQFRDCKIIKKKRQGLWTAAKKLTGCNFLTFRCPEITCLEPRTQQMLWCYEDELYFLLPTQSLVENHCGGFTWFQHALCERLPVEGVSGGVEQMPQDDGSVHDVPRGQNHGVGHECVHQRVCNKVMPTLRFRPKHTQNNNNKQAWTDDLVLCLWAAEKRSSAAAELALFFHHIDSYCHHIPLNIFLLFKEAQQTSQFAQQAAPCVWRKVGTQMFCFHLNTGMLLACKSTLWMLQDFLN